MLKVENVSKEFKSNGKKFNPLENINLEIGEGEFVCLLGPSGCGKSTLLNIIAGLERPSEGRVFLGESEIVSTGVERAVMFQESALFPWLNVRENVEFGMKIAGIKKSERREKAEEYLKMVHLGSFKDSLVHELSGGMKQRVALARALTLDSEVLLMDEPFSALDSQTKSLLQQELQNIWWKTKKTIVFVTHNVEEAVLLADRIIVMSSEKGSIKSDIRVQLARPRTLDNLDIARISKRVKNSLKGEVEEFAKREFDGNWDIEKDRSIYTPYNDMGAGL